MPTLKFKNPNTGEWEVIGYGGDMYTNTYDPQGKAQDIFQYVDDTVAAIPTPDVSGQISEHNTDTSAHNDIRGAIPTKTSQLTNDSGFITNPVDSDLIVNGSVEVAAPSVFHDDVKVGGVLFADEEHSYLHTGDILDYAAPAGYGLGTKAVDISEKNITEIAFGGKWGLYRGIDVIGAPMANVWYTYEVFPSYGDGTQGYASIVATNVNDGSLYTCAVIGTTITAWKQLATTDSKPTYTYSEVGAAPAYTYGTTDLTAGSSSLTTGTLYFVYEPGESADTGGSGGQ